MFMNSSQSIKNCLRRFINFVETFLQSTMYGFSNKACCKCQPCQKDIWCIHFIVSNKANYQDLSLKRHIHNLKKLCALKYLWLCRVFTKFHAEIFIRSLYKWTSAGEHSLQVNVQNMFLSINFWFMGKLWWENLFPAMLYDKQFFVTHTVPLNYNFTFTFVDTHGATQNFAWKQKFPRDETWHLAWHLHEMRLTTRGIVNTRLTTHGKSMPGSSRIITDMTSHNIIMLVSE